MVSVDCTLSIYSYIYTNTVAWLYTLNEKLVKLLMDYVCLLNSITKNF